MHQTVFLVAFPLLSCSPQLFFIKVPHHSSHETFNALLLQLTQCKSILFPKHINMQGASDVTWAIWRQTRPGLRCWLKAVLVEPYITSPLGAQRHTNPLDCKLGWVISVSWLPFLCHLSWRACRWRKWTFSTLRVITLTNVLKIVLSVFCTIKKIHHILFLHFFYFNFTHLD